MGYAGVAGILDWSDWEVRKIDVKVKMRLTLFGVFNKKGSVVRLYLKRKDGGRIGRRRSLVCLDISR